MRAILDWDTKRELICPAKSLGNYAIRGLEGTALSPKMVSWETISVAIGQGAIAATPIQLAYVIGGIITGGRFHQPHLPALTNEAAPEIDFPISDSTVETVTQGMYGVVNEQGGTGSGSKLPGIELCGKTGSAQVISNQGLARTGKQAALKDNAWFVGFAPRQNPEIVVSVLVQGGEHMVHRLPRQLQKTSSKHTTIRSRARLRRSN